MFKLNQYLTIAIRWVGLKALDIAREKKIHHCLLFQHKNIDVEFILIKIIEVSLKMKSTRIAKEAAILLTDLGCNSKTQ